LKVLYFNLQTIEKLIALRDLQFRPARAGLLPSATKSKAESDSIGLRNYKFRRAKGDMLCIVVSQGFTLC
jgi:hypothetical protein